MDCELLAKCPTFEKSTTGVIKGVYSILNCRGSKMEECARRELRLAGKVVPPFLLPSGEHLETLK